MSDETEIELETVDVPAYFSYLEQIELDEMRRYIALDMARLVGAAPELNLSDLPTHDRMQVQVDCYSLDDTEVVTLATAVRDAIEPSAAMTAIVVDQREPETGLYRMALQFDFLPDR